VVVLRGTGREMIPVPEMEVFGERFGFRFVAHAIGNANRSARVERPFTLWFEWHSVVARVGMAKVGATRLVRVRAALETKKYFQTFLLLFVPVYVSLVMMKQERIIRQRDRLLARLPEAREILRGSLLQRTIRHRTGCPKCTRGEGHPVAVLAVGYPGSIIRQISLPQEQVAPVRRSLANYRKLKAALEKICELNQQLLRSERDEAKRGGPGD
jgi:hypothetical protein